MDKKKQVWQALGGILCLIVGALLTVYAGRGYTQHRYIVDAAACRMDLVVENRADLLASPDTGSVVLFHGLSANKVIMQYWAHAFAQAGLRVFLPDLPGHGRSPGPFTPEQGESCSASLLRGLAARGMIIPDRTILVGHSMGGAIALRLADKFRPAGVIAISPAPMVAAHGLAPENLLFHSPPLLTPNTLILAAQFDAPGIRDSAADLAAHSPYSWAQFSLVPWNTHVSVLFSPTVARELQASATHILGLPNIAHLPSRANIFGCLLGIVGLLLIAGPFIREMVGNEVPAEPESGQPPQRVRGFIELALLSAVALGLLHFWHPVHIFRLFEGDYLAAFFLILGLGLILLHLRSASAGFRAQRSMLFGAAVAGLLMTLLVNGWFELTLTGTWLNAGRWERFPLFFLTAFLFLYGLELLAGPAVNGSSRYPSWFLSIVLAWLLLSAGVLYFHSGEILLVLLSPYFALLFLSAGLGIQLVRRESASPSAAALFGAILLAGFCLVIFPVS